jgi:hypothetical protein
MAWNTNEDRKVDYYLRKKLGQCAFCPRRASPARVLCTACAEKASDRRAERRRKQHDEAKPEAAYANS